MTRTAGKNPVFLAMLQRASSTQPAITQHFFPMGASAISMKLNCRLCSAQLTLEEMHYFDSGDGTAICTNCESTSVTE